MKKEKKRTIKKNTWLNYTKKGNYKYLIKLRDRGEEVGEEEEEKGEREQKKRGRKEKVIGTFAKVPS